MAKPGPKPGGPYTWRPTGAPRPAKWRAKPPAPPDWLSAAALAVWRRTAKEMKSAGILASIDADLLALYSAAVAEAAEMTRQLDRDGPMLEVPALDTRGRDTGRTIRRPHPLLRAKDQTVGRVRQLADALGIGPAARGARKAGGTTDAEPERVNKVLEIRERVRRAREGGAG